MCGEDAFRTRISSSAIFWQVEHLHLCRSQKWSPDNSTGISSLSPIRFLASAVDILEFDKFDPAVTAHEQIHIPLGHTSGYIWLTM